jgi:uncharacterized cupin superfamily protein
MARPRNMIHEDEVAWEERSHGEHHALRRRQLGRATGGEKLGCSLYELPPGKRTYPLHYHHANEEAIYVLDGEGVLRLGEREIPLRAGDYVTLRAGEPDHAHQVQNRSGGTLRFLCFSTMLAPDVAVYVESKKIGVFCGSAPGAPGPARTLERYLPDQAAVDYWQGEE